MRAPVPPAAPVEDVASDLRGWRMMRWTLRSVPDVAELARALVRDPLVESQPALGETVALLTDELVANAVVHGAAPIELVLWAGPDRLRVGVVDGAPMPPLKAAPDPRGSQTSGRGLFLVERLASRWGVTPLGAGKQVWFELDW